MVSMLAEPPRRSCGRSMRAMETTPTTSLNVGKELSFSRTRAVEDQSAPLPEEITSEVGRMGRSGQVPFWLAEPPR